MKSPKGLQPKQLLVLVTARPGSPWALTLKQRQGGWIAGVGDHLIPENKVEKLQSNRQTDEQRDEWMDRQVTGK